MGRGGQSWSSVGGWNAKIGSSHRGENVRTYEILELATGASESHARIDAMFVRLSCGIDRSTGGPLWFDAHACKKTCESDRVFFVVPYLSIPGDLHLLSPCIL